MVVADHETVKRLDRQQFTFAELRQLLGIDLRALKVLLWFKQHPELRQGAWEITIRMGLSESVKIGAMQMLEVAPEVSSSASS